MINTISNAVPPTTPPMIAEELSVLVAVTVVLLEVFWPAVCT